MSRKENDPLIPGTTTTTTDNGSTRKERISALFSMHANGNMDAIVYYEIQPESIRFYAYIFFWLMAIIAILLSEFIVKDRLAAGPEPGQPFCPPFELGVGFDLKTESHLIKVFGFNNICSNWDYHPAREIVAMIYPLFEYTLILYLIADFVNTALSYQKGWVSRRYFLIARILFPIMIILCSWFRMIFVILVYDSPRGHTAGFLGLQLTLMLVALLNVWYLAETRMEYKILRGRRGTRICSLIYLICNLTVSAAKFWLDVHVVLGFAYPSWGNRLFLNHVVGHVIDMIWMFFNALLPLIIAYIRSKKERPLEITINLQPPQFILQRIQDQEEKEEEEEA